MEWFNRWRVSTKLVAGFMVVAAIGAVIGFGGIRTAGTINDAATLMYERELNGIAHAKEANIQLTAAERAIRSAVIATDAAARAEHLKSTDQHLDAVRKELALAGPSFSTQQGKALFAQVQASFDTYVKSLKEVKTALDTEDLADLRESTTRLKYSRDIASKADGLMTNLAEMKIASAHELNADSAALFVRVRATLIGLTLGGVVAGIAIGLFIARNLNRQLGGEPTYAAEIAQRIAEGDLTAQVEVAPGDTRSMLYAMKLMRDSLAGIVGKVRAGADNIATASDEIAAGNVDLSARTEEQAGSLEETASSMEELTTTVRQNSENARQANVLATSASEVATKGGVVVSQVVETMGAINQSARKIVDIIGVIDGIAFQTNILALNAAVEAARAGEQGRGFAVVASEVRNLAQRSANAAKEIKTLIADSVERVETGSKLVDQAGATMDEILAGVQRVTDIMAEIAAAGREQELGIEQINRAIGEMDGVTQQNATLVEQAATAAASLQRQAAGLAETVSVFRLDREGELAAQAPLRAVTARSAGTAVARAGKQRAVPVAAEPIDDELEAA